jgi:hypothetical protein
LLGSDSDAVVDSRRRLDKLNKLNDVVMYGDMEVCLMENFLLVYPLYFLQKGKTWCVLINPWYSVRYGRKVIYPIFDRWRMIPLFSHPYNSIRIMVP